MESLKIKKLSAGTIYKLICVGSIVGFFPLCLLLGVMGVFGMETVTWNEQPVTGIKALFVSPLIGVFISLVFTAVFGSITAFGLWLYSFSKPVTIIYFAHENS